jgi:uncharacterized protein (DUF488 family)
MYYRRKIIAALLQEFGGTLSHTDFQKYLFLLTQYQEKPSFFFVPYKYGSFSFQSAADLRTMQKYGFIEDSNERWTILMQEDFRPQLTSIDREQLAYLSSTFSALRGNSLIEYVYREYPYFAIKSKIAERRADKTTLANIQKLNPSDNTPTLFTIGYEGRSIDEYANELVRHNVKLLCDVRRNPLSMKYGFSKTQLSSVIEKLGIRYVHVPELGIASEKRQALNSQEDYDALFADYEQTTLPNQTDALRRVYGLFTEYKRIALTCFEAASCQCHRSKVAEALCNHQMYCLQFDTSMTNFSLIHL